jgi:pimeloyl-ACP methyl ester carboxylesterase
MHRVLAVVFSVLVVAGTLSISSLLTNNSDITSHAQKNKNSVNNNNNNNSAVQRVSFLTDDKVLIVGTYYAPQISSLSSSNNSTTRSSSISTNAIILLHMLGRNRNDWNSFASTLSNRGNGYAVLPIDLRGHGESTSQNGNTISFQSFTTDDFNKMVMDVKAAKQFLVAQKNIKPNSIAIVGASIGANVALNYAALDPSIKAVILLSPGLDYKGVTTSDAIKQYNKGPIYIATAGKDPIAGNDPQTLCNETNCDNRLKVYQNSNAHGTDMFSDSSLQPPLDKLVASWLNTTFGKSQ